MVASGSRLSAALVVLALAAASRTPSEIRIEADTTADGLAPDACHCGDQQEPAGASKRLVF